MQGELGQDFEHQADMRSVCQYAALHRQGQSRSGGCKSAAKPGVRRGGECALAELDSQQSREGDVARQHLQASVQEQRPARG